MWSESIEIHRVQQLQQSVSVGLVAPIHVKISRAGYGNVTLKRDDFSSNRHPALAFV
jgi:sRNA-binding carbon storage regulator CsrA